MDPPDMTLDVTRMQNNNKQNKGIVKSSTLN